MKHYTELDAWKIGLEIVKIVYSLTKKFPSDERFALTTQANKAVTSILANLAEGAGRYTYADKANKYVIAWGECSEVEAIALIAVSLGFITQQDAQKALPLIERERKILSGMIAACRSRA